jgi:hypothetical protein
VVLLAVLVVGNGSSNMLSTILFPSVSKAVTKLKRVPVAVVGCTSVQHYGKGERAGEVEPWDGGCALQVPLPAAGIRMPSVSVHYFIVGH